MARKRKRSGLIASGDMGKLHVVGQVLDVKNWELNVTPPTDLPDQAENDFAGLLAGEVTFEARFDPGPIMIRIPLLEEDPAEFVLPDDLHRDSQQLFVVNITDEVKVIRGGFVRQDAGRLPVLHVVPPHTPTLWLSVSDRWFAWYSDTKFQTVDWQVFVGEGLPLADVLGWEQMVHDDPTGRGIYADWLEESLGVRLADDWAWKRRVEQLRRIA